MRVFAHRAILFVLRCCFVINGTFQESFLPLWKGCEEFSHLAFVEHLAARSGLPDPVAAAWTALTQLSSLRCREGRLS
jgi:hypothetical protein